MGGVFWRSYKRGAVRYTMACLRQAMLRKKNDDRTPSEQPCPNQVEYRTFLRLLGVALGGTSCMGVFYAVGEGVANLTGPSMVMAISIAVITALITAMCFNEVLCGEVWRSPYLCLYATTGEFAAFAVGWLLCLSSISAIAGVSRLLSALIDRMTKNYMRDWIGHFPQWLADPDPMAAGVSLVAGIMVSAGLEESDSLVSALVFSVVCATIMVSGAGVLQGSWKTWQQQKFLAHGFSGMLLSASVMAGVFSTFYLFGCRSRVSRASSHLIKASGVSILFSFLSCFAVSVSMSSLIHYKLLRNSIAILEVFDHKIEWAELGVGIASIFSLSLVLLEWLHPLNELIRQMSTDQLLFAQLAKESSYTGTRVLPVMLCALLAALLATFLPSGLLLRIFAIGLLGVNIIFISVMMYQRYEVKEKVDYQPFGGGTNFMCARWIRKKPSRRQRRDNKLRTLQYLKQGISTLPTSMSLPNGFTFKGSPSGNLNTFEGDTTDLGDTGTHLESDKEHLLVRSPGNDLDSGRMSSSGDEDSESSASGYETDSSSDTDIDAIVQEYKEKLKVATLTHVDLPSNRRREPTLVTSRRVAISVLALLICFGSLSIVVSWEAYIHTSVAHAGVIILSLSIFLVIFLLLVLVSRQPEVPSPSFRVPLSPWSSAFALLLNTLLFANCICDTWPWLAAWICIGLCIYFGYGVRHSSATSTSIEPLWIEPAPCQALVSAQPSTSSSIDFSTLESDHAVTQIDTVLITR